MEEGIRFTHRMEHIVKAAADLAGDSPVGTEHVLLALLGDPRSIAAQAIAEAGVADRVTQRLHHLVASEAYRTPSTIVHADLP